MPTINCNMVFHYFWLSYNCTYGTSTNYVPFFSPQCERMLRYKHITFRCRIRQDKKRIRNRTETIRRGSEIGQKPFEYYKLTPKYHSNNKCAMSVETITIPIEERVEQKCKAEKVTNFYTSPKKKKRIMTSETNHSSSLPPKRLHADIKIDRISFISQTHQWLQQEISFGSLCYETDGMILA